MDVFTHFVVPYLLAWGLRLPKRERLAAGIGGYAPDMDAFTAVVGLASDDVYALGHRGLSHSLLGAPLYALGVALLVSLPFWGNRWPRLAALRFDRRMLLVALLASYTHLALDAVTMWGVPLLYPWSAQRFSVDWSFYSVLWAIPLSAAFVWLLWRRAPDRRLRQVGALLVAVILLSGAARLAWRPDDAGALRTFPIGLEWQWATVHERPGGYDVQTWSFGARGPGSFFPHEQPTGTAEREALERARSSSLAKGFLLYAGWPVAVQVDPVPGPDVAWEVTFTDVMRRAQFVAGNRFTPTLDDFGVLVVRVDAQGVREVAD